MTDEQQNQSDQDDRFDRARRALHSAQAEEFAARKTGIGSYIERASVNTQYCARRFARLAGSAE